MGERVKIEAGFLLSDLKENENKVDENRKIFEEAGLLRVLGKIVYQELGNKHLFISWGEDNLNLKLKVPFDQALKPFVLPEKELEMARNEGLTVLEIFLSTNNEMIFSDDWYGKSVSEGDADRNKLIGFIGKNVVGIKKEDCGCVRKTKDTVVLGEKAGKKPKKNSKRVSNLIKDIFN